MKRLIICSICLLALAAVFAAPVRGTVVQGSFGNTVSLAWDANAEPDLAGYKVHWGRASGRYDNTPVPTVAPGANPTFTTPVLPNGTWYFAVTAYNTAGVESGYSNEVSKAIAMAPAPPKSLRIWILQSLIRLGQHLKFWA